MAEIIDRTPGPTVGGMKPDGVVQLVHEWLEATGIDAKTQVKIKVENHERASGSTPRVKVKSSNEQDPFILTRVNPPNGGNENCWTVTMTVPNGFTHAKFRDVLKNAEDAINNVGKRSSQNPEPPQPAEAAPYTVPELPEDIVRRHAAIAAEREEILKEHDRLDREEQESKERKAGHDKRLRELEAEKQLLLREIAGIDTAGAARQARITELEKRDDALAKEDDAIVAPRRNSLVDALREAEKIATALGLSVEELLRRARS